MCFFTRWVFHPRSLAITSVQPSSAQVNGSNGAASDVCVVDEQAGLGGGVLAGAGGDAARWRLFCARVTGAAGAAEDEGVGAGGEGLVEDDEGFAEDEEVRRRVTAARAAAIRQMEETSKRRVHDFDCRPGALVLVRNSKIDTSWDRKAKKKYGGPYVVVARHRNGNYTLGELDGAVSATSFAASRVVPYYPRTEIDTSDIHFIHPLWPKQDEEDGAQGVGDEEDHAELSDPNSEELADDSLSSE